MTNPILPSRSPARLPTPQAAIATTPTTPAAPTAAPTSTAAATDLAGRRSPIQKQHRDQRGQPDYTPVKLVFLNGPYQGKALDLGLAINEVIHSQSAEWGEPDSKGIRVGVNFTKLSSREISLNLEFADLGNDILHLVEGISHVQEIGDGEKQPPYLLLTQGSATIAPLVCESFQSTLDEPHPGDKGFRHATVQLRLKLAGGKGGEHALGKPLTSTPLGDERAQQTRLERQRQGQQAVAKFLLAPCLGESGSDRLISLIEQGQLGNVDAIAKLDDATFVQAAIGGLFSAEILSQLAPKLRADLAQVMAVNEAGVGTTPLVRQFAQALLTGDPANLPAELAAEAIATKADFEAILEAVRSQNLGEASPIYSPGSLAGERLRSGFGACGISLRQSGALAVRNPNESEAEALAKINQILASATNEELKEQFGIENQNQLRLLRNGVPYQSKLEFLRHTSQGSAGINGYALWSSFEGGADPDPDPLEEL